MMGWSGNAAIQTALYEGATHWRGQCQKYCVIFLQVQIIGES